MDENTIKKQIGFFDKKLFQFVDKKTFQIINPDFIKDKHGVYLIVEYFPTNTEIKNNKINIEKACRFAICKDYFTIKDIHFVHRDDFNKIHGTVVYYIAKLNHIDQRHFKQFKFKEKTDRYMKKLSYYLKDKENVYYLNAIKSPYFIKIKQANVSEFVALTDTFARDDRYCYFMGKKIAGADPATFKHKGDKRNTMLDIYTYQDKNRIYINDNWCRVQIKKK